MTFVALSVAAFIVVSAAHAAPSGDSTLSVILYVDDDAPPNGDGRAWRSAFSYLQDALAAAREPNSGATEIHVAQGTYRPDQGQGILRGDQDAAFDLVNRVALRGGYAGIGSPEPDARDVTGFPTVLSGDLLGNDGPEFTNYQDNAFRVLRATNLDMATVLDGFNVRASQSNPGPSLAGGGLFCLGGGLTVTNCRFERNLAYIGGAIASHGADVIMRECAFTANKSEYFAGVVYFDGVSPNTGAHAVIEDSTFDLNDGLAGYGGALYAVSHVRGVIRRCTFTGNRSNDGAVAAWHPMRFEECTFTGNFADKGGAVKWGGTFVRCRFENNIAAVQGGAYEAGGAAASDQARFIGCVFRNNRTNIMGGGAAFGGAAFVHCAFHGNRAGVNGPFGPGGALQITGPAVIEGCVFTGNRAIGVGGAIANNATPTILNCSFFDNDSTSVGTAIYGHSIIYNSLFGQHNGQAVHSVLSVDYSCTMQPLPAGIRGTGNIIGDPRFVDPLGPDGIPGTEDDDLRLRSDSPCIDAGDSTALPADTFDRDADGDTTEPLPIDILGNRRVLFAPPHASPPDTGVPDGTGAIIDMGAHEFRRPVDCAPPTPPIGDGFVNIDDLLVVISGWGGCDRGVLCIADVNGDGVVNIDDLLAVVTGWG